MTWKTGKQREKNTLPCENIEDMQIKENLIVCFSDNSYDNCNPTKIELSFLTNEDKKKFWYRQVCSYFQVGLGVVTEEFDSLKIILCVKRKDISRNKMVWIVYSKVYVWCRAYPIGSTLPHRVWLSPQKSEGYLCFKRR